ncbi:MAG: glycosyltransferase family 2 protein, partial [Bacteroidaceae bacterium]|nr:glycosyltransferase family 2 protein [Bacteroidaceae bacterium]
MKTVSIIIPAYNEQESLQTLYSNLCKLTDSLKEYNWEILFVNDGSSDNTECIINGLIEQDPRIATVILSRNFGKEAAMLAGFDYATGDCAIILDADLQHPISAIPQMLQYWEEGYDDVYARRRTRGDNSWLRKFFSRTYYSLLQRSSNINVLPDVGDFRLLDRKCIDTLKTLREQCRYTKGMYAWIGYKKKEITFDRGDRVAGQSNWGYNALFNLAIEGIT